MRTNEFIPSDPERGGFVERIIFDVEIGKPGKETLDNIRVIARSEAEIVK